MDFGLNDEPRSLYDAIVAFARDVVEPEAGMRDREVRFDRGKWGACAELGLMGPPISPE